MVKRLAVGLCLVLAAGSMLAGGQTRDSFVQKTGADVIPIYEGWYRNPDGMLSLSFGYLNRNYDEEVDIPVGPANRITVRITQGDTPDLVLAEVIGTATICVERMTATFRSASRSAWPAWQVRPGSSAATRRVRAHGGSG